MSEEKQKNDEIAISASLFTVILAAVSAIFAIAMFVFYSTPYTAPLVFTTLLFIWAAYYAVTKKSEKSEMCCMMNGMIFGMVSGFFIGALVALTTTDFLVGMVVGTISGIVFGIPIGKMGGPLAKMEAVMAAPMGGIMGAMTGVMIAFYNIQLFMPFFVLVMIFTAWEAVNMNHKESKIISKSFIVLGVLLSVVAFSSTIVNDYSLGAAGPAFGSQQVQQQVAATPPPAIAGVQEITITAESVQYNPSSFVVKKDVPVKLTVKANANAGCTRSFVFPEYNIRSTIPQGGSQVFEFTPTKTGAFPFSCIMSMARGTMKVQN